MHATRILHVLYHPYPLSCYLYPILYHLYPIAYHICPASYHLNVGASRCIRRPFSNSTENPPPGEVVLLCVYTVHPTPYILHRTHLSFSYRMHVLTWLIIIVVYHYFCTLSLSLGVKQNQSAECNARRCVDGYVCNILFTTFKK